MSAGSAGCVVLLDGMERYQLDWANAKTMRVEEAEELLQLPGGAYHEVISCDRPCRLFADVDCYTLAEWVHEKRGPLGRLGDCGHGPLCEVLEDVPEIAKCYAEVLQDCVLDAHRCIHGVDSAPDHPNWRDYRVMTCHRPVEVRPDGKDYKISMHLVFPNVVVTPGEMYRIRDWVQSFVASYSEDGSALPYLDLGKWCISSKTLLRAVHQIKADRGEVRDATPLTPEGDHPVRDYIVTYAPADAYRLEFPPACEEGSHSQWGGDCTVTLEDMASIVGLIPASLANTYDDWLKVVLGIKDVVKQLGGKKADFMRLAVAFSQRFPAKYNEEKCKKGLETRWKYDAARNAEVPKFKMGSFIYQLRRTPEGDQYYRETILARQRQAEACLFVDDPVLENPIKEEYAAMFYHQWAQVLPADSEVAMVYLEQPGRKQWAFDGDQTYLICPVSGLYRVLKEEKWKAGMTEDIMSLVLPIWQQFARSSTPPNGVKLHTWQNKLAAVSKQLKSLTGFMEKVAIVVRRRLMDDNINKQLDSNVHLLGFENGVIDLSPDALPRDGAPFQVRRAEPHEYVSKSCGYEFRQLDTEECQHISDILADMWVRRKEVETGGQYGAFDEGDADGRETMQCTLEMLASNLHGGNVHHAVLMLLGVGSNGKTVLVNLMKSAVGEYAVNIPKEFWTSSSTAEGPTPMLMSFRGARFGFTPEIDASQTIQVPTMKDMTGGDEQSGRFLFSNEVHKFYIDLMPVWNINNMPDKWSEPGHAVTRRPRGIDFPFVFSRDGQSAVYAKLGARELTDRKFMKQVGLPMMNILLQAYLQYAQKSERDKFKLSKQMEAATKAAKAIIDHMDTWLRATIEYVRDDAAFIPTKFLFEKYKQAHDGAKVVEHVTKFGNRIAGSCKMMQLVKCEQVSVTDAFTGNKVRLAGYRCAQFKDPEVREELAGHFRM